MLKRKKLDFAVLMKSTNKNKSNLKFFNKENFIYRATILKRNLSKKKINILLKKKKFNFHLISNSKKFLNKKNETKVDLKLNSKKLLNKRNLSLPIFKSQIAEKSKSNLSITKNLIKKQRLKNFKKLLFEVENKKNYQNTPELVLSNNPLNLIEKNLTIKYKKKIKIEFPLCIKNFPLKIKIEPKKIDLIIKVIIIGNDFSTDLIFTKKCFIIKKNDIDDSNNINSIKFYIKNNEKNMINFKMSIFLNFEGFLNRRKIR